MQFSYVDPEKRKKFYNSKDDLDEEVDEVDGQTDDPRLKKEEAELRKISSGISKVFLKTVKEREKVRAYKKQNIDPRNASRTPSGKTEINTKLRYDNPVNACTWSLPWVVGLNIVFVFSSVSRSGSSKTMGGGWIWAQLIL